MSEEAWDSRCEWLRTMGETYFVVCILDEEGMVVASGTVFMEKKLCVIFSLRFSISPLLVISLYTRLTFTTFSVHNMGTVAHIQDLAVARNQKGKKMGLRILQALVYAATESGCYKILVHCTQANEAFHAQCGFVREGSGMVLSMNRKPAVEPYMQATQ